MKDVVIYIRSLYGYDENEEEAIDFSTDGLYTYDGGTACLTYLETDVTGMEGTQTRVVVTPEKVVVDRDGSLTSRMVFKEGEKTSFLYSTPYGRAVMGINTRKVSHSFNDKGGKAEIEYVVDMQHTVFTKNRFTIQVKQDGGRSNA